MHRLQTHNEGGPINVNGLNYGKLDKHKLLREKVCETGAGGIFYNPLGCRGGMVQVPGSEWGEQTDHVFAEHIVFFSFCFIISYF